MKICPFCKKSFELDTSGKVNQKKIFCSEPCRKKQNNEEYRNLNSRFGLPPGTVGTIHELRVCLDLLKLGYEVFKNVTPNGVDLAVIINKNLIKVEVVTGYHSTTGKINHNKAYKEKKWDCLAIVLTEGKIYYEPSLEELDTR